MTAIPADRLRADLLAPGMHATAINHALKHALADLFRLAVAQGHELRHVCGTADKLAAAEHNQGVRTALTVKAIARTARPALRVVASPGSHTWIQFFTASCRLRDLIEQVPAERLAAPSLRHELGAGPHNRLLELARAHAENLS